MSINLIQSDVKLMRARYDEALQLMGIPAKYQYPILADSNNQGESIVDHYSISEDVNIFFEGSPKIKTYKRVGWVVENDENLPFLIHCSFNLKNLQREKDIMQRNYEKRIESLCKYSEKLRLQTYRDTLEITQNLEVEK